MLVSDRTTYIRTLVNTPQTSSNRWPDTLLIPIVDRGVKAIVARIIFPESRNTLTAIDSRQEYPLMEMHELYRVYLDGQICVETPGNVDTLEGDQIGFSDQTGSGTIATGGGGAPGGTTEQPQWAIQTPTAYPFLNSWGSPAPNVQPFFAGQRPRFYRRGGSIGFVPAPMAGTIITIDCIRVPNTLTAGSQPIVVPDNFADAIDDYCINRMLLADRDPVAREIAREYGSMFEAEVKRLRTWKRQYSLEDAAIQPLNYRGFYTIGGARTGSDLP
jgi:hypothetical protein